MVGSAFSVLFLACYPNFVFCEGTEELPVLMELDNLHLTDSLKQAKDALFDLCGIYAIKCLKTGALYIGSSTNEWSLIFSITAAIYIFRGLLLYMVSPVLFLL